MPVFFVSLQGGVLFHLSLIRQSLLLTLNQILYLSSRERGVDGHRENEGTSEAEIKPLGKSALTSLVV